MFSFAHRARTSLLAGKCRMRIRGRNSVSAQSIFGVTEEFCARNNLEYMEDYGISVLAAMKILNKVCCGVDSGRLTHYTHQ